LDGFAERGGTALPSSPKYYQADDAAALMDALDEIVTGVVSCDYRLDRDVMDLSQLHVFLDRAAVDRDPAGADGWNYDAESRTVTFYGSPCQALRDGDATDVDIVFGCAGPTLL
jgi:hypothetical protein